MSTVVTALRRRIPLVNLDKGPSIPLCFVLKLTSELAPANITNGLGELGILDHVLARQILDADRLVFTNHARREFVLIITPSISYLGMDTGNLQTSLVAVLGTLFLLGEPT